MANERWISLASGGGTTFEQMAIAIKDGRVKEIVPAGLIASKDNIEAIKRAKALDIPHAVVDPRDFLKPNGRVDRIAYGDKLWQVAHDQFGATFFTQNGHLPLTPTNFIQRMQEFGIGGFNQHPGSPIDFGGRGMYGKRVHAAAIHFLRRTKGEMFVTPVVQKVAPEVDAGVVVNSSRVAVLDSDEYDDLQERVLPFEHSLNIQLLKDISSGNVVEQPMSSILKPGEEVYLQQAKEAAILLIPAD